MRIRVKRRRREFYFIIFFIFHYFFYRVTSSNPNARYRRPRSSNIRIITRLRIVVVNFAKKTIIGQRIRQYACKSRARNNNNNTNTIRWNGGSLSIPPPSQGWRRLYANTCINSSLLQWSRVTKISANLCSFLSDCWQIWYFPASSRPWIIIMLRTDDGQKSPY